MISFDGCNAFDIVIRILALDMFDAFVHVFAICDYDFEELVCLPVFHDDAVALHCLVLG